MPDYWAENQKNDSMKNYTEKDIRKAAFSYMYKTDTLLFNRHPKFDRRYNFSREVLRYIYSNPLPPEKKAEVLAKRKQRRDAKKMIPVGISQQPIIKDWLKNKRNLRAITADCLLFWDGRRHWAKTKIDRVYLSILSKHFNKNAVLILKPYGRLLN